MNSTDSQVKSAIERFFVEEVQPLAERLHAIRSPVFFLREPDLSRDSYFTVREKVRMSQEDFAVGGCRTSVELKQALRLIWLADGHDKLLALAAGIAELADSAHKDEELSDEVSPFIYVMF